MSPRSRANGHAKPRGKKEGAAAKHAHAPKQHTGPDVAALERFLRSIGVDPDRDPEYSVTAALLAELLAERTSGLREGPPVLRPLPFVGRPGESVTIEGISFYGLCPHHLVPYIGEASVRFAPLDRICGAGALVRAVRELALVPQLQEHLTQEIADLVDRALAPRAIEIRVHARHLCMELKGSGASARLSTEAMRGESLPALGATSRRGPRRR
jgi:GTP cyclohydrolase I